MRHCGYVMWRSVHDMFTAQCSSDEALVVGPTNFASSAFPTQIGKFDVEQLSFDDVDGDVVHLPRNEHCEVRFIFV